MPYAKKSVRALYDQNAYRGRKLKELRDREKARSLEAEREQLDYVPPKSIAEKVRAVAEWSRSLKCPPGHPRAGEPLELPEFVLEFFTGALGARRSVLSVARKNAKSSALAILALSYLVGPLRVAGWRGAVVSVNLDKSREFLRLASDIVAANQLDLKVFRKSIKNLHTGAELECLPATSEAGHASGFDAVFLDELGLFPDNSRALIRGMFSSVSARDGKVFVISIRGDCEPMEELLKCDGKTGYYVQMHAAPPGCSVVDESAWHLANPGLKCGIKSLEALKFDAESVATSPSDMAFFRAHELNMRLRPDRAVLTTVDDWLACETEAELELTGAAYMGIDLGAVSSMSAAAVYFPDTGGLIGWGCFPGIPSLRDRGRADGVDGLYLEMVSENSLKCFGEKIPDYAEFLTWVFDELGPIDLRAISYDRFRKPEIEALLDGLGIGAPRFPRGTGASARADGSHDVRAFQRSVMTQKIRVNPLQIWRSGLRWCELRTDEAGNPALSKSARRGRIDVVSAAVLAVGLSALDTGRPRRSLRWA